MRQLINQNSFVLAALGVLAAGWFVLRRRSRRFRTIAVPVIVLVLVVVAVALRTGTSDVASGTELDRVLAKGKPVALEFYSNF